MKDMTQWITARANDLKLAMLEVERHFSNASDMAKIWLAISVLQDAAKDDRIERAKLERQAKLNEYHLATDKQLAFLRKLGVKVVGNITKQEANKLINQALDKRWENDVTGWKDVKGEKSTDNKKVEKGT